MFLSYILSGDWDFFMAKRVLFTATVVKAHINVFHKPYLAWFKEHGFETHVCALNDYPEGEECIIPNCDFFHNVEFSRSPFSLSNIRAYRQLKKIIDRYDFDIIHCHTPTASVLTRLAAVNARKKGTKVLYTAHGFHFYKGASWKLWTFYPIEKILSDYADGIITINHDDYNLAVEKHFCRKGSVYRINGIGVDIARYMNCNADRFEKRSEFGIPDNSFVLISAAELNKNKNYTASITAFAMADIPNSFYVICGEGSMKDDYIQLAENLGISDRVIFAGYRNDMPEMYKMADAFIFTSIREGFGNACIEAMAAGLPLIVSNSRGTKEYAENGVNAFVYKYDDCEGFAEAIKKLADDENLRITMGKNSAELAVKYDISKSAEQMAEIYNSCIGSEAAMNIK